MPTVFNRIWAFHKNQKAPFEFFTQDRRSEIGSIVAKEYFTKHFTRRIGKVKTNERDTEPCLVWNYPPEFRERLDKLILNYYRKINRGQSANLKK